jgi:hypothetical protein
MSDPASFSRSSPPARSSYRHAAQYRLCVPSPHADYKCRNSQEDDEEQETAQTAAHRRYQLMLARMALQALSMHRTMLLPGDRLPPFVAQLL